MGLIRILLYAAAAMLAYLLYKRITAGPGGRRRENPFADDERIGRLEQDPVCGVYVDSGEALRRKDKAGEPVYFCSKECADAYKAKQQEAP